jgi:transposase
MAREFVAPIKSSAQVCEAGIRGARRRVDGYGSRRARADGHGSLAGAVRRLGLEPTDGHLYLFMNKRRRIAKALWFDGSGWCVLAKRLETGSFQLPVLTGQETQIQVNGATFALLLAGIDLTASRRGWYRRRRHDDGR